MKKITLLITLSLISCLSQANILTVTSSADSGAGTLRQALADAADGDTINFNFSGSINVTSTLDISKDITIIGPGAGNLAIDGGGTTQIFADGNNAHNTVEIYGLGIRNGFASSASGAAILANACSLTISNCDIFSNHADDYGGAIAVLSLDTLGSSSLTIINSSIRNNSSGYIGGAISMEQAAVLTISNSTLCNNSCSFSGAAIYVEGSAISLTNVTIANNSGGPLITGLSIFMINPPDASPSLTMENCIFNNTVTNYDLDGESTVTSLGHNISNDNSMSAFLTATGDLNNTDPLLDSAGASVDAAGTAIIDLQCGSPAINAGALVFATDQAGDARIGAPDIGAYESSHIPPDTNVVQSGAQLTATATGAAFVWLDCNAAYGPVNSGTETSAAFNPAANGSYAVMVAQNGCMDTSSCRTISNVGIPENNLPKAFSLFPNPAQNQLTIQAYSNLDAEYIIYDAMGRTAVAGRLTATTTSIDVHNLCEGLYVLSIGQSLRRTFEVRRNEY